MSETEINRMIDVEYVKFNNEIYSGDPVLPKDLIEIYRKAIFKLPPSAHRTATETINKIIVKKVKDLTNFDVPTILNTITLCPFSDLYPTLEEALKKNKEVEQLKVSFNILVKGINEAMDLKRQVNQQ